MAICNLFANSIKCFPFVLSDLFGRLFIFCRSLVVFFALSLSQSIRFYSYQSCIYKLVGCLCYYKQLFWSCCFNFFLMDMWITQKKLQHVFISFFASSPFSSLHSSHNRNFTQCLNHDHETISALTMNGIFRMFNIGRRTKKTHNKFTCR